MSRITKWKFEKTKVKVVFRLQFHATHIPQTGWERLFISFIPTENGKVTAKTTKANVRNGICKWGDPIYETTRLLLDAKSKLFDDKLYKLVVGMGSSRSSILGEAIINLADYADALKPSAVALPLHGTDAGTILHVTVQLLTSKTGFREFEQQRELRETGLPVGRNHNRHDESGSVRVSSSEQKFKDQTDKVDTRLRFTKEPELLPSLEEAGESEEYADSQVGCDGSSNTSGSLYTDKHDTSSTHDIDSVRSTASGDLNRQTEKGDPSDHRTLAHGGNEWVQGWSSDYSMDNDLAVESEESIRLRGSLEAAESSISELKLELNTLESHAKEIGLETQKLANQLVTEIASGQELAKGVSVLKSECSNFKDEFEKLKRVKLSPKFANTVSDKVVDLYEPGSPSLVPHLPESTRDAEAMAGKILELLQQLDEAKVEKDILVRKMDKMENYYEALVQELEENQKQMLGEFYNLRNDHSTCLHTISSNNAEMKSLRHDMNEQALRFSEERLALDSLNKELERRAITSESALKRARLNYFIAVNQLQKDLDLLSFQVSSMFETNQNLINDAFSDPSQMFFQGYSNIVQTPCKSTIIPRDQNETDGVKNDSLGGDILSDDMKKSLCLQEDLYQKVEVELFEMRSANLFLDIYSNILKDTLVEASTDIRVMQKKINEYALELELSNESRNLLVARLQTAVEDVHVLNEDKAGCLAQYNHLLIQNQSLEAKLESFSKESFFLTEKLINCEAQLMEYQGCERKYEACLAEKLELENFLKLENLEKGNIHKEMSSLKEEFQTLKDNCDKLAVSKESMQKKFASLQEKMRSLLASFHSNFGEVSPFKSSVGQNLESKDIKGIIEDLEEGQQNICEKMVKLIEEKKGVENERDMAALSLSTARSEVSDMKQKFKNDMQDMVAKLDISNFLLEKLQFQLESVANKFHISLETEEKYLQHGEELLAYLASMEIELQNLSSKNGDLAQEILGVGTMGEEIGRCKLTISKLMQEKQNLEQKISGFNAMAQELGKTKLSITELKQEKQELAMSLKSQTDESVKLASELDSLTDIQRRSELIISELIQGKQEFEMSLQSKTEESSKLESELRNLTEKLEGNKLIISQLMRENKDLSQEISGLKTMVEELGGSNSIVTELKQEKQDLVMSLSSKTEESIKLKSELDRMAEELGGNNLIISELMQEKQDHVQEILGLKAIAEELGGSKLTICELLQEKENFVRSLERKTEEIVKFESELERLAGELGRSKLIIFELTEEKQNLAMSLERKTEESLKLESELRRLADELGMCKLTVSELMQEKQGLLMSLQSKIEESTIHESELDRLKESLRCVNDEMHVEREFRDKLEGTVANLTSQLYKEQEKSLNLDSQNAELVSDLKSENSRALNLLQQYEENIEKLQTENHSFNALGCQLIETEENLIGADIKLCFVQTQYETLLYELLQQLQFSHEGLREMEMKHSDAEAIVDQSLSSEAQYTKENGNFLRTLKPLKSELESSAVQNGVSSDANNLIVEELEECKNKLAFLEVKFSEDNEQHSVEVEQLKHILSNLDQEIVRLIISNEESEIIRIVLKDKLEEQNDELIVMRDRCYDLTRKLSEQILKTEEFKNMSIYLKELKDKAEAESALAREKRESEGSSIAVQESLRIAFIKEQYETKLQELRQQLSMSKRHSEEILFKLQDAIDETENLKRSEVFLLKKNEELSLKVLELEAELQSLISDKREKINDFDRMKTELECALLSLECCKEEKEKLNAYIQKCEEKLSSGMNAKREENGGVSEPSNFSDDLTTRNVSQRNLMEGIVSLERRNMDDSASISTGNPFPSLLGETHLKDSEVVREAYSVSIGELDHLPFRMSAQSIQEVSDSKGVDGIPEHEFEDEGDLLLGISKRLAVVNDHFRAQTLKSSIEHLDEELERMKNENSLLPPAKFDPSFQDLQKDLLRLQKANQELASIYPLFNDLTGAGNALERVLALEIELAEALRAKTKSSTIQFQSSFLKQHSDEEAVFKSFRDINELIRDMLELKGKYTNVERELQEMHDRYSQLSLQFAEVEGEKQKLAMTLKSVRASKKQLQLNRSTSAILSQGDHSF